MSWQYTTLHLRVAAQKLHHGLNSTNL